MFARFALIGHPIGHSMSPFIHQQLFSLLSRSGSYSCIDVSPEQLPQQMAFLRTLDGFNVTIPHKQAVLAFLDELDPVAERYGAVNTVLQKNGRLIGCNTDAFGFIHALRLAGITPTGRVLICGCGGVARTIALECALRGCEVTLAVRNPEGQNAQRLLGELQGLGGKASVTLLENAGGHFNLAVNATPLGMYPNPNGCALSRQQLLGVDFVFDTVYNPENTLLLQRAAEVGVPFAGGMLMLVLQAAEAQRLWYGAEFSDGDLKSLISAANEEMTRRFTPA